MKKKLAIVAMCAAVASIAVGGSLAFYTAEDTAHNVITSGGVDIELVEKHQLPSGELVDFPERVYNVCPGAAVSKIVRVQNVGPSEAWVRVAVSAQVVDANGTELPLELPDGTPVLTWDVLDGWIDGGDGFYYYNVPLQNGAQTKPLFNEVAFDILVGNEYQGATATVTVDAGAVQTANNGSVVTEAQGWPVPAPADPGIEE